MIRKCSVALQLLAALCVFALALPGASAQAKGDTAVAPKETTQANQAAKKQGKTVVPSPKAHAAGVESCAGVIAAIGAGVPGWVAAAIAAPFCGKWMGEQNVRRICSESRQWWGYGARAFVRAVTWNRYSRC